MLDQLTGWAFVAPAMVIILGLSLFPAVWAFVLSLQKWNGFSPPKFVGLDNYSRLMTDDEFWAAVTHTGLYVLLFVPASVLLGLFLAVALNRDIALIGLYRTAIFVPFVASAAATGILATYLFSPQYGLANNVLRSFGLPAQGWLEDQGQAMLVIAIMSLWGQAAFTTVIY
ncbi:sugar ABC transporter permease, partial [Schumannella luteola]